MKENYKVNKAKNLFEALVVVIVIATVSIIIYDMYMNIEVNNYSKENKQDVTLERMVQADEIEGNNITDVIENVSNAVVGISKLEDNGFSIFSTNSAETLGLGSGIVISEDGYVLTNEHVSGNKYSNCYVTTNDGEELKGTVIWADDSLDLSIIKVNKFGMSYAQLGDSSAIKVGQNVYAIGNPIGFEFQRTVTKGIISAKDRAIKVEEGVYMSDLIQTDATINPGNSGGPLILETGEIIGINSVKISSAEGIGFAIPINVVKPIIKKLTENEEFNEASIGIFAYDKNVIPYLDSNINFENGIYVADIKKAGPAEKSGIKVGDIITKIDGKVLNKMNDLREYIYTKSPNDEVVLSVIRNKKEIEIKVKLGSRS